MDAQLCAYGIIKTNRGKLVKSRVWRFVVILFQPFFHRKNNQNFNPKGGNVTLATKNAAPSNRGRKRIKWLKQALY